MNAVELYSHLERDFIFPELRDEWASYMGEVEEYLCHNFKDRSMGLVCDFAREVNKVYTAVFPTESVMQKIIDDGTKDAMLFVHHPSIWDISKAPNIFYQMDKTLLEKFKENRISIYNLHVPLDNFSEYSTSKTLADALDVEIEKPFGLYYGSLCGVIGRTECRNVEDLQHGLSKLLGHNTKLYLYGDKDIEDGRIAIVAGGGNSKGTVNEMLENNVKVLITGVSSDKENNVNIHKLEQKHGINVLGGTHYSTEKFACQKICLYFENLGLNSLFIEGEPALEDM